MKFFVCVAFIAASAVLILADEAKKAKKSAAEGEGDSKQQDKRGLLGLGYGYPVSAVGGYGAHHGAAAHAYAGVPALIPGVLYGQDVGYTRSYYTAAHHPTYAAYPAAPHALPAYHAAPAPYGAYPATAAYHGAHHASKYGAAAYPVHSALPYSAAAYPAAHHSHALAHSKYDAYAADSHPTKYEPYSHATATTYGSKPGYSLYGRLAHKKHGDYSYGYKASDYDPYTRHH